MIIKHFRKICCYTAATITFGILGIIVLYILVKGVPNLKPSLFALHYTTENVSMMPAIITTFVVVILSQLISIPIGLFTAIFMVEYLNEENKFVHVIRMAADTLAAVPSIVYGLFGMLFFVYFLKMENSVLAGVLTVSIMVLPVIIRASEEALMNVRKDYRFGSFALGAGKIRTVFKVVLPAALPGILSGVILSIGRVIGESAALIFTLGTSTNLPTSLFKSGRTLAVHMYVLSGEGLYINQAYATAVVILVIVVILNFISTFIGNRLAKHSKL